MKLKVFVPTFFWFKYTCVMSWVIIVLSTVTACLNIAALTSCNDIRNQVPHLCAAPFVPWPSCNPPAQGSHTSCTNRLRRADL